MYTTIFEMPYLIALRLHCNTYKRLLEREAVEGYWDKLWHDQLKRWEFLNIESLGSFMTLSEAPARVDGTRLRNKVTLAAGGRGIGVGVSFFSKFFTGRVMIER